MTSQMKKKSQPHSSLNSQGFACFLKTRFLLVRKAEGERIINPLVFKCLMIRPTVLLLMVCA
jgi:hypothetical protein